MTESFATIVVPVFRDVLRLLDRLQDQATVTLEEVMGQVRSWIEAADHRSKVSELRESYQLARYGLVAWIDEMLTQSSWGNTVGWGSEEHVLEWYLYSSRDRYDRFYRDAERAESRFSVYPDALEVYLLCVTLGFRGKYKRDPEQFSEWVGHVYEMVSQASALPARPFSEQASREARALRPLGGGLLLLAVSGLVSWTALMSMVAYMWSVHARLP